MDYCQAIHWIITTKNDSYKKLSCFRSNFVSAISSESFCSSLIKRYFQTFNGVIRLIYIWYTNAAKVLHADKFNDVITLHTHFREISFDRHAFRSWETFRINSLQFNSFDKILFDSVFIWAGQVFCEFYIGGCFCRSAQPTDINGWMVVMSLIGMLRLI